MSIANMKTKHNTYSQVLMFESVLVLPYPKAKKTFTNFQGYEYPIDTNKNTCDTHDSLVY